MKVFYLKKMRIKELISLAKEEIKDLKLKQDGLFIKLKQFLIPKDPMDEKNVIMEIRPAAGGNEASFIL